MPVEFKKLVGRRIKEVREKSGISQAELASNIGVGAASVSSYEKGSSSPSLSVMVEIAKCCNTSIDWLCGVENNSMEKEANLSSLIMELLRLDMFDVFEIDYYLEAGPVEGSSSKTAKLFFSDVSSAHFDITPENETFFSFFQDWLKMRQLYKSGSIDSEVYQLWIEKTLNKYSDSKLPTVIPF